MKKNEKSLKVQRLADKARDYGREEEIGAMIAYLESKGTEGAKGLPAWSEFESKTEEYGIKVWQSGKCLTTETCHRHLKK